MSNEHERESGDITPYVPNEWDRDRLAAEVRVELCKRLHGEHVTRYLRGGERAKIRLARGEDLLQSTRLEFVRTLKGRTHVRAWVTMQCVPPPGREFLMNEPYCDMVEVYFAAERTPPVEASLADPPIGHHRYAAMDDETPMRSKRAEQLPEPQSSKAIRAISMALLLGVAAVIGEQHFGVASRAKDALSTTVEQLHQKYDEWRGGQWAQPPPRRYAEPEQQQPQQPISDPWNATRR